MSIFEPQYDKCILMNVLSVDSVRTDPHTGKTLCPRCATQSSKVPLAAQE